MNNGIITEQESKAFKVALTTVLKIECTQKYTIVTAYK